MDAKLLVEFKFSNLPTDSAMKVEELLADFVVKLQDAHTVPVKVVLAHASPSA